MTREQTPDSPEQVSDELRQYLAVVQAHQDHPFVRGHFHQVTWLGLHVPEYGEVAFYALEFRDGLSAALTWQDGQGNWGVGRWLRLTHPDTDITTSPVSVAYFQDDAPSPTFPEALARLAATRGAAGSEPPAGPGSLRHLVRQGIAALLAHAAEDDEAVTAALLREGVEGRLAVRLVQFIPIAFCRFVFRASGVQFAEECVVLGPDGQPADRHRLADDPVFQEATAECEAALLAGQPAEYFFPVAARSGGFQAIQELLQKGARPEEIRTGPPVIRG